MRSTIAVHANLQPWLKSASGEYVVRSYDQHGKPRNERASVGAEWKGKTDVMQSFELALFEVTAK